LAEEQEEAPEPPEESPSDLYPVATLRERRRAALIDAACLAFAYGGFLALFGSLGGEFTLSKLSAVVCFYLRLRLYPIFRPVTIFGGTTPGMMVEVCRSPASPATHPPRNNSSGALRAT